MSVSLRCLYDFVAEGPSELSVAAGEMITGLERTDDTLWWVASNKKGQRGLVPCNYTEEIKPARVAPPPAKTRAQPPSPVKEESVAVEIGQKNSYTGPSSSTSKSVKSPVKAMPSMPAAAKKPSQPTQSNPVSMRSGPTPPVKAPTAPTNLISSVRLPLQAIVATNVAGKNLLETNTKLSQLQAKGSGSASKAARARSVRKQGKTQNYIAYALWGHYLACFGGWFAVFMGPIASVWSASVVTLANITPANWSPPIVGIYTTVLGVLILIIECLNNFMIDEDSFQVRNRLSIKGLFYFGASILSFFSVVTAMPAVAILVSGIAHLVSGCRQEINTKAVGHTFSFVDRFETKERENAREDAGLETKTILRDGLFAWLAYKRNLISQEGKVGETVCFGIYMGLNAIVFSIFMQKWYTAVAGVQLAAPATAPTMWIPWAKAFGGLLDFNAALIIFPILRPFLNMINEYQVTTKWSFIKYIPLRKNFTFHKIIAKVVLLSSSVHTLAHFMNAAFRPNILLPNPGGDFNPVTTTFGLTPWISGALICISMVFIYSAAPDLVKRADFELFWFNHHFFIIFFGCTLIHALSAHIYLMLAAFPIALYILERIFRVQRGNNPVIVRRIKYIKPVMEIRFQPENKLMFKFTEGQYLYLNCPFLSDSQWHPFTISSAYDDLEKNDFISVHIRVMTRGGWTDRLKEYFEDMNPTGQYPFNLLSLDASGKQVIGKKAGVDGRPFLRMDGPHSAPCQHYQDYKVSIIIGAGIGLTPVSSIMRGTLLYKWKKGFQPNNLYFCWVVRHDEVLSYQWFIHLLQQMNDKVAADRAAGSLKPENYLEVHIYVTGFKNETGQRVTGEVLEEGIESLLGNVLNPVVKPTKLKEVMSNPAVAPNKFGDIWIWNGRPDWDQYFSQVKEGHQGIDNRVGVCYCGPPVIGKDLKRMCDKYSSVPQNIYFNLHKENF